MKVTLLAIDTASSAGSIALCRDEKLCGEILFNVHSTHSERLMVGVRQVLADTGTALESVDAFVVVHGPGSFTGLRVGMATAKGLAMATGRPLIGVSSLQTLAMNVAETEYPVCALLDARKKEVYAGLFRMRRMHPVPLASERVIAPADLVRQIKEPMLFVGEGAVVYRSLIEDHLGVQAHFAPWVLNSPRASLAALLALERLRLGETQTPLTLIPAYIRPSEAEITWALKHPGQGS
ncbi:tRNA threonylcarbamoyladenosine biosynthesis protein TsaB [Geoalkalibacter ferrihydriticus]|uniref:tRNA threonylcarbamoyladenosine biosynthesis protein TsaB n=1 Tax=Geoalkalibacter ferrihydriticus TaxID=392333 RepID=A0A1G9PXV5_9BACT|nr:tRNA (adenosine(37)-N6)-threonylcarbamoyltransferase complex dimerization subunit type 1 TsaB [Geoalkalibacter ferrihydriticus]SDM02915.1 tRNA threonylcarbamoyladenosine biosynthesis protein TsaB [Geoalkalibacter ferrihydriticus]